MYKKKNINRGINVTDVLKSNRALIVKLLAQNSPCSRSMLAKMSKLSQAAITKIINELLVFNVVKEVGLGIGKKGRRTIELKLNSDKFMVIAIKISRKEYEIGIYDLSGKMKIQETYNILDFETSTQVLKDIAKTINRYCIDYPRIIAAGISVPGPYLRNKGFIAKLTEFNNWEKENLLEYFTQHIKISAYIEHDANAGAIAEWWFGKLTDLSIVNIYAGEGIGSGIILNGQLLYGTDGIAGEIGHMSIDFKGRPCNCAPESHGCLEQYCSSIAFIRDVKEQLPYHTESSLYNKSNIDTSDIFKAANDGDRFATSMVKMLGFYFGVGISNVINIYNPDAIIISDIMVGGGELMMRTIFETVQKRIIPEIYENLSIRYTNLGYDSALYGAAAVAINGFLNNPFDFIEKQKID